MDSHMETVLSELSQLRKEMSALTKMVRKMRNQQDDPDGEKAKERSKNNGFNRPQVVSPELRKFLGLGEEEMISRSEVTKRLNTYVKDSGLKHPDNGRVIILDDKLTALLKPPEGVQVTFLNVQKYLSPHYVKTEVPKKSKAEPKAEPEAAEASVEEKPKKAARPTVKKTTAKA